MKDSEKESRSGLREDLYPTVSVYVLLTALVIILFTALCFHFDKVLQFLQNTFSVFKPIVYALFLAFLFVPMERFFRDKLGILERKKARPKLRKALSLLLTYITVVAVIVAFASIIIPQAVSGYNDLSAKAPDYIRSARSWLDTTLNDFDFLHTVINIPRSHTEYAAEEIVPISYQIPQISIQAKLQNPLFTTLRTIRNNSITVDVTGMMNTMLSNSITVLDKAFPYVWSFLSHLLTEIKNILIGLIISVYVLASRQYLAAQVRKFCAAFFSPAVNEKLAYVGRVTNHTLAEYLSGKLLDSLVVGFMCFIGMSLLNQPYTMLISVLVGVLNIIPFVGPIIGGVTGALILFIVSPTQALWFLIMMVVIQQIDGNLIEPHIMDNRTGLPPLFVICCVLIMGGFFGGVGLFLGVPVFAVVYMLMKEWVQRRLTERQIDVNGWSVPEEIQAVTIKEQTVTLTEIFRRLKALQNKWFKRKKK